MAPDWAEPFWNRGYAYVDRGEKALAIADFEKYLELSDDEESRQDIEKELLNLRSE